MTPKITQVEKSCQQENAIVQSVRREIRERINELRITSDKAFAEYAKVGKQDVCRLIGKKAKLRKQMNLEKLFKILIAVDLLKIEPLRLDHLSYLTEKIHKIYEFINEYENDPELENCLAKLKAILK